MGIMHPYFPAEMAINLSKIAKANTFVETGTYYGETSKWASSHFEEVHTIELSDFLYQEVKCELLAKGNIIPYLDDSRNVLPQILENKKNNILFWLDGHYSAGVTAGKNDPCPLLRELEIILCRDNEDIVLIDDARCLIDADGWPTISDLYKKIKLCSAKSKYVAMCDDNLYIVPDKDEYKELLLTYALRKNVYLWEEDSKKRNKGSVRNKIVRILKSVGLYKIVKPIYKKMKR